MNVYMFTVKHTVNYNHSNNIFMVYQETRILYSEPRIISVTIYLHS